MAQENNKGIQMSGGTINADAIAVGDNAHAESGTVGTPGEGGTHNTANGDAHTVIQAAHIDSVHFTGDNDE